MAGLVRPAQVGRRPLLSDCAADVCRCSLLLQSHLHECAEPVSASDLPALCCAGLALLPPAACAHPPPPAAHLLCIQSNAHTPSHHQQTPLYLPCRRAAPASWTPSTAWRWPARGRPPPSTAPSASSTPATARGEQRAGQCRALGRGAGRAAARGSACGMRRSPQRLWLAAGHSARAAVPWHGPDAGARMPPPPPQRVRGGAARAAPEQRVPRAAAEPGALQGRAAGAVPPAPAAERDARRLWHAAAAAVRAQACAARRRCLASHTLQPSSTVGAADGACVAAAAAGGWTAQLPRRTSSALLHLIHPRVHLLPSPAEQRAAGLGL